MVNLERHHRKIRIKATLIHIGLIPLAILVPLAWIYFTFGVCQEAESAALLAACRASLAVPLLPVALGILALAFIVWDLAALGTELHAEAHGLKSQRVHLRHTMHGLRGMDEHHQRHVHFATLQVIVVGAALLFWLLFEAYRTTH
jgi:hypothetical protein